MSINEIDWDAIYNEGYRAQRDGLYFKDCPYEKGTAEAGQWLMGYQYAEEGSVDEDNSGEYSNRFGAV
jgi:hypothetical protein